MKFIGGSKRVVLVVAFVYLLPHYRKMAGTLIGGGDTRISITIIKFI